MTRLVFNPRTDTIAEPEALAVPGFDTVLALVKDIIIERVRTLRPDDVDAVTTSLANPAEMISIIADAMAMLLLDRTRKVNYQLRQLLALFATGTNLDAKAVDYGLTRQVLIKGDATAVPPIADVMESDEDFLIRILLQPFAWATTGSEMAYRFHALTLGDRPITTIETPEVGKVVVTYQFPTTSRAAEVRDARAKMETPETGRIGVWLLARDGDGVPTDNLISYAQTYLNRNDIRLGTDEVTAHKVEKQDYAVNIKLHMTNAPGSDIDTAPIIAAITKLADANYQFEATVDPQRFSAICYGMASPVYVEVISPAHVITCNYKQAPRCTGVTVEAVYDQ